MRVTYGLGRLMFGGFFLYSGIKHFTKAQAIESYAAAKGQPYPHLQVAATGVLLLAAGASVALGVRPRVGAAVIAAFLAAVTPVMHDFWTQADPGQRNNEMLHFSKNLAMLGAALALAGDNAISLE